MRTRRAWSIGRVVSITLATVCLACGKAAATEDDWTHDVTVLTITRTGAWGAATRPSVGDAIAGAIQDCRRRAAEATTDCGALQVSIRNGWSVGYLCGSEVIAVTGKTLQEAQTAAMYREIDLAQIEQLQLSPCDIVVALDPRGRVADLSRIVVAPRQAGPGRPRP